MVREKEKKKSGEQQRRRSVPALFQRGWRQSTMKQQQQSKNDDDTAESVVGAVVDSEASEQIEDTTDDDLKQLGQLQNGTGGSFGKRRTTLLPAKSISNNGIRRLSFQNLGGRNRRRTTAIDNTDNNSNDSQSRKSSISGRRRSSISQIMFGMKWRPKIKKLIEKNDFDQIRELLVEGSSNRKSLAKWLEECTDVQIVADHIHSCFFFDGEDAIITEHDSYHQPADDPDKNGNDLEGNGYNNIIALHLALERHPPIDIIEEFTDLLPDNIMIHCDSMGQTPLHVACRWGAGSEIISQLLEYSNEEKVVLVNKLDNSGRTPLHHACIISGLSIDQYRKEQGTHKGSKKRVDEKTSNGYSHDYADSGDDHHSIESGVDDDNAIVSTTGNKSIKSMSAAERRYEKEQDMLNVIQILIEIDPKCVLKRDTECGKTPYDYAIEQKSSADIINLLKGIN